MPCATFPAAIKSKQSLLLRASPQEQEHGLGFQTSCAYVWSVFPNKSSKSHGKNYHATKHRIEVHYVTMSNDTQFESPKQSSPSPSESQLACPVCKPKCRQSGRSLAAASWKSRDMQCARQVINLVLLKPWPVGNLSGSQLKRYGNLRDLSQNHHSICVDLVSPGFCTELWRRLLPCHWAPMDLRSAMLLIIAFGTEDSKETHVVYLHAPLSKQDRG